MGRGNSTAWFLPLFHPILDVFKLFMGKPLLLHYCCSSGREAGLFGITAYKPDAWLPPQCTVTSLLEPILCSEQEPRPVVALRAARSYPGKTPYVSARMYLRVYVVINFKFSGNNLLLENCLINYNFFSRSGLLSRCQEKSHCCVADKGKHCRRCAFPAKHMPYNPRLVEPTIVEVFL